jgi:hypothetical protein
MSKDDLVSSSLALYEENPAIALMAAVSALDEMHNLQPTESSLELKTYLEASLAPVLKSNYEGIARAQDLGKHLHRVAAMLRPAA